MLKLGGSYAAKGTYWSAVDGSLHDMTGGGVLKGDPGDLYIRRPAGGAFVVVPAIAVLYALTFPALGPLAVLAGWVIPLVGVVLVASVGLMKAATYTSELAAVGWRPVNAYFAGLRNKGKKK